MRAESGTMNFIKDYPGYTGKIAFAILVNQCTNHLIMNEKTNALLTEINLINQSLIE